MTGAAPGPQLKDDVMNQEQLMARYLRLQRKLASSYQSWHSGRIDRLADALRAVEQEMRARQLTPTPTGHLSRQ